MSEPVEKPNKNPESFSPKKPEIVNMMDEAGQSVTEEEHNTVTLNKIEYEQFGPYRLIGKSVYARAGGMCASIDKSQIIGGLCENSKWIFKALDNLNEYATDEIHKVSLMTWEKYDEKNKLMGYTVGKFMKAGSPVPDGMDYIDIPATYVAKGWFSGEAQVTEDNAQRLIEEAIKKQGKYNAESWRFTAEVYTGDTLSGPYEDSAFGYYMACSVKVNDEKAN